MKSLTVTITIIAMLTWPALAEDNFEVEHKLRLLPTLCTVKTSPQYQTLRCITQRKLDEDNMFECEVKRGGILVEGDAKRELICVKDQ